MKLQEIRNTIEEASNPMKTFARNEDQNYHSKNAVLVAKHVGDEDDVAEAKDILKQHNSIGHLTPELGNRRNALMKKLYPKFEEKFATKG